MQKQQQEMMNRVKSDSRNEEFITIYKVICNFPMKGNDNVGIFARNLLDDMNKEKTCAHNWQRFNAANSHTVDC